MTYTLHGWTGTLAAALICVGLVSLLCAGVDGVAWLLPRIPGLRRHPVPAATADGRNVLRAVVRGASFPELESAALDRARDLYGPGANLTVVAVEHVATSLVGRGLFAATVYVRHLPAPAPAAHEVSIQEASTTS